MSVRAETFPLGLMLLPMPLPLNTNEASPRTAEVVVGLAGDVAVGWGDPGGLS